MPNTPDVEEHTTADEVPPPSDEQPAADLTVVPDAAQLPPDDPGPTPFDDPPPPPMPLAALERKHKNGKGKSEIVQVLEKGAVLRVLSLEQLVAGDQPRKHFEASKIQELADSIISIGLQQPPLVRPMPDGMFQIVVGDRRCRAAKRAGLKEIPVLVREIADQDVLDAQIAENIHRVDLSALEEGAAYDRMTRPVAEGGLGRSVDEVAARVQRSKSWVYGRMKLLELCPEGVRALEKGQILPSVAEAVARIADPARQAACVKDLVEKREPAAREEDREPVTLRRALEHIRANYMLDLARAPFDKKDIALHLEAGACTTCPHNSGTQPGDLFAARNRPHCLKPSCYAQKVEAHWDAQKQRALASEKPPAKVLTLRQGAELYKGGNLSHTAAFVELDGVCHEDTGKVKRTWRKLLGESCPPVTLAPDTDAKPHELVERGNALLALQREGHKFAKRAQERNAPKRNKAEEAALELEESIREQSRSALIAEAVRDVENPEIAAPCPDKGCITNAKHFCAAPSVGALRLVAKQMLTLGGWAGVAERRGIQGGIEGCQRKIEKMTAQEAQGLIVELALVEHLNTAEADDLRPVARELGINLKDIEERVRKAVEASVAAEERANAVEKPADKPRSKAKGKRKAKG